jgi:uncharacterized membrane protein
MTFDAQRVFGTVALILAMTIPLHILEALAVHNDWWEVFKTWSFERGSITTAIIIHRHIAPL